METLKEIQAGKVDLAFRRWKRPTVKVNGTLTTTIGVLRIDSLETIALEDISPADAQRAGFASKKALTKMLSKKPEGEIYRIEFHLEGEDPRIKLREKANLTEDEFEGIRAKLQRMDIRSRGAPWTEKVLKAIDQHPETRAAVLADLLEMPKESFKINVRKLKNLGLTVSLSVGYRLSPRGAYFLGMLDKAS